MSSHHFPLPTRKIAAADLIPIHRGRRGIPNSAIIHDVELLIATFLSQDEHSMSTFAKVWSELDFGYIHITCLEVDDRPRYLQAFYDAILDHVDNEMPLMRVAVVYALYFVYFTQPNNWPPSQIRVNPDTWNKLFDFYITCCRKYRQYGKVALAFKHMRNNDAFLFTADNIIQTSNLPEFQEMAEPRSFLDSTRSIIHQANQHDVAAASTVDAFENLSKKYQAAKRKACATPQAVVASKVWLKNKANINESNPRHLQKVILSGSLAIDESEFVDSLKKANKDLWIERKRQLEEKTDEGTQSNTDG